jgi:cis-3-alkyl-4-acyloxetan-2-one decarboxylase
VVNEGADRRAAEAYRALYPFESHWLDLDGVRYHYLDEGPAQAPPIVMLHGNPTWSFYYRDLVSPLSQGYRIVVPDHVGCGLSDKPQDYDYCLAQHIANLEQLIDALALQDVTFVLHDWGGAIGMGYATRHPDNVARLVILNTAAFYQPTLPLRIKLCRLPILGDVLLRRLNAFARLALPWATHHTERLTPAVRAGYLAPYDSWHNRIAILRFVRDIPLERHHPSRQTLEQIESNLYLLDQHPMLILWGAEDFVFTVEDYLTQWQARFPFAEVHVIPDAGHYVVEDAHERIAVWIAEFMATRRERPA